MAQVIGYEQITLPDGTPGTIIRYDNGAVETVDANNERVDYTYGGTTPLAAAPLFGMAPAAGAMPPSPRPMRAPQTAPPEPQSVPAGQAPSVGRSLPSQEQSYDLSSGWNHLGGGVPAQPASGGVAPAGYGDGGGNPFTASSTQMGGFGEAPRYHDGSQHPLQGGFPRTPGGTYRGPNGGVDSGPGTQMTQYDTGASAGPYGVQSPRSLHNPLMNRAFDASGRAYATRGDNRSPLYDAFRAKGDAMESKVRGMAGAIRGKIEGAGGGGGGASSAGASSSGYSSGSNKAYARQQHRYNKDARQQQRAYEDGSYLYDSYKMRGFSKKMDPQQAEGLMFRPSMLLPKVAKGLPSTSPRYGELAALPAAQLSMLAYGHRGKAKDGPSQFTNNLAKFYEDAANRGDLPSYGQATRHLATAKPGSPLGQMFKNQPLGFGAQNYESMVTAIMGNTGLDPGWAAARTETAQGLIDRYGSRMLKKDPRKATPINRWVARKVDFL
jgi:hypothetical protein